MTTKEELSAKERMFHDTDETKAKFVMNKGSDSDFKQQKKGKEMEAEGNMNQTWLQKLKKELKPDVKLIPLKILSFLFFGGMFSITPFFTLHMQQLGLSVREIAVIYSVLPLPAILGPVISGIVADWSSNFKGVLVANIVLNVLTNLATTLTPTLPSPLVYPIVDFNYTGLALARPDCDIDNTNFGITNDWLCSSECFSANQFSTHLNSTHHIRCSVFDPLRQVPLEDCMVQMADDPDCGHALSFLPRERDLASLKLGRSSLRYMEQPCSVSCNKTEANALTEHKGFSNSKTFWIYFVVRFLSTMFLNGAFSMMDASIMAVILKSGGDYGKQRLVAMLSMATFPFIASCIVVQTQAGTDYSPVFYLMTGLLTASVGVAYFIDIEVETQKESQNYFQNLKELFKRMEVNVFLLVIFLLGANWGFLENYLFVFLNSLKAPTYLLGLTMTFGCLTGVPMLLVSDRIVEKFGRQKVFFVGFLAYTVRMFGYSFITNPWYCFIFEALEVLTYQMMWVAAVTFFPILAPTSLLGTLSGIAGAVHYNIGRGGGAFIGGFLISHIGMIWTFRAFGIASFVFAIGYFALQKLYLNKVLAKKAAAEQEIVAKTTETA